MTKKSEILLEGGKYLTLANKKKPLKKQKIRNSEYYDMQLVFDELYAASIKGHQIGIQEYPKEQRQSNGWCG